MMMGFALSVIRTLLTAVGAKPTCVDSGNKAVAAMKEKGSDKKYKAILLDFNMPNGISGVEACKQIRAISKTINIFLLSGDADSIKQEQVTAWGMNGLLMKPVRKDTLAKWLATVK